MMSSSLSSPSSSSSSSVNWLHVAYGAAFGVAIGIGGASILRRSATKNIVAAASSAASVPSAVTHPLSTSAITVGSKIPMGLKLYEKTPSTEREVEIGVDVFLRGRKVVLFGVPGAFTTGCTKTHLPGYIQDADKIKSMGIDEIACVSVNDSYTMEAWGKSANADGKVRMFADPAAAFTSAIGLTRDIPSLGGLRSKRYSAVIDNGTVTQLNIDSGLSCSLASNLKL